MPKTYIIMNDDFMSSIRHLRKIVVEVNNDEDREEIKTLANRIPYMKEIYAWYDETPKFVGWSDEEEHRIYVTIYHSADSFKRQYGSKFPL